MPLLHLPGGFYFDAEHVQCIAIETYPDLCYIMHSDDHPDISHKVRVPSDASPYSMVNDVCDILGKNGFLCCYDDPGRARLRFINTTRIKAISASFAGYGTLEIFFHGYGKFSPKKVYFKGTEDELTEAIKGPIDVSASTTKMHFQEMQQQMADLQKSIGDMTTAITYAPGGPEYRKAATSFKKAQREK